MLQDVLAEHEDFFHHQLVVILKGISIEIPFKITCIHIEIVIIMETTDIIKNMIILLKTSHE
jgi:hypothetical protein